MRIAKLMTLVAALAGTGAAFAQQGPIVKIDGSSTVYPITEAVAEEYQKMKKNAVKVTVGPRLFLRWLLSSKDDRVDDCQTEHNHSSCLSGCRVGC